MKFKFLLFLFFFFPCNVVLANNSYHIESYDVYIDVNTDNSFDVKEVISVYFSENKRGIIRNIPFINEVKRTDGTVTKNIAKITNFKVNKEYKLSKNNMNYNYKIGDENIFVSGLQEYIINYKYSLGNDYIPEFDELYFNIIGTKWDTYINQVNFIINMPKEFDESKVGFSVGAYGSVGYHDLNFQIKENKIEGSVTDLKAYEGLTIRVELEEGYFSEAKTNSYYIEFVIILISFTLLLYTVYLWFKYGKDDLVVEPVQFYPPQNLNSLEVAFNLKEHVKSSDIVSLLIYLADKGYLKIKEEKKKQYKFIKGKDYDGNKLEEEMFLNSFFAKKEEVTLKELKNKFYLTIQAIGSEFNSHKRKNDLYTTESQNARKKVVLFIITIITISIFIPILKYGYHVFFHLVTVYKMYVYLFVINSIIVVLLVILHKIVRKRTEENNLLLGEIKGFRNFLKHAKKDRLEVLVNENPTYFYNILPFTYIFGLSKTWIKQFESIAISPPEWYESNRVFDYVIFSSVINNVYAESLKTLSSVPSQSSSSVGGGFSGGGFSGGGSGGGGGSSW